MLVIYVPFNCDFKNAQIEPSVTEHECDIQISEIIPASLFKRMAYYEKMSNNVIDIPSSNMHSLHPTVFVVKLTLQYNDKIKPFDSEFETVMLTLSNDLLSTYNAVSAFTHANHILLFFNNNVTHYKSNSTSFQHLLQNIVGTASFLLSAHVTHTCSSPKKSLSSFDNLYVFTIQPFIVSKCHAHEVVNYLICTFYKSNPKYLNIHSNQHFSQLRTTNGIFIKKIKSALTNTHTLNEKIYVNTKTVYNTHIYTTDTLKFDDSLVEFLLNRNCDSCKLFTEDTTIINPSL